MTDYFKASQAFERCRELIPKDTQLNYNLGLTYFKLEQYERAINHLKLTIESDKKHKHAYNNLAFIFNMHQKYELTFDVCKQAEVAMAGIKIPPNLLPNEENDLIEKELAKRETLVDHGCHRHWAFALYKRTNMTKAIQKIKEAIALDPNEADNWIVWGLIMRKVGSYQSAMHKFQMAEKLDPYSIAAK